MDSESFQQFSRLFNLIPASLFAWVRPMRSPLFALKFEFDSGPFSLENLAPSEWSRASMSANTTDADVGSANTEAGSSGASSSRRECYQ